MSAESSVEFCELTGGGPCDGARVCTRADRKLMLVPVCKRTGPGGAADAVPSERWVHAYVRLRGDEFVYDGIRERC